MPGTHDPAWSNARPPGLMKPTRPAKSWLMLVLQVKPRSPEAVQQAEHDRVVVAAMVRRLKGATETAAAQATGPSDRPRGQRVRKGRSVGSGGQP